MKTIILLTIALVFSLKGISQQKNYKELYAQALNHYFNPALSADSRNNKIYPSARLNSDGTIFIDTVIVQKEKYLPEIWPQRMYTHVIKYLAKEEIDNFKGRSVNLMVLSPIRESGGLYLMKMTNYSKAEDVWISRGFHQFRFSYDQTSKRFSLSQPVITFCSDL